MPVFNPPHNIKAVLFDMDGTIFDTESIYEAGWLATAKAFGQHFTKDDYKKMVGVRRDICHQMAHEMFGENFPMAEFIAAKDQHNIQTKAKGIAIKPGFEAFFQACITAGLKTGLVTSSYRSAVNANFARLSHFDYLNQFDCIVTVEDVINPKPAPECYIKACQLINVPVAQSLVFEDSNPGSRSAIAAQCQTIMIPDFLPPAEDVSLGLLAQCANFDDALVYLNKNEKSQ